MDHSLQVAGGPTPARVYLARLAPGGGRKSAAYQLRQIAELLTGQRDIDAIPWAAMSRPVAIAIVESLRRQGKATTTINHCLSILKGGCEEAEAMGLLSAEACRGIAKVRSMTGRRLPAGRAPAAQEVRMAIDQARSQKGLSGLRDAAMIATLAGAGLRCAELIALRPQDVQGNRLMVHGKGGHQDRQPLTLWASELLQEWVEALDPAPHHPLFPRWRRYDSPGRHALSPSGVRVVVQRYLPDLSPHDLRRGYATWLASAGHGLPVIQRLMRHASPATTMTYIRNEEEMETAAAALRI